MKRLFVLSLFTLMAHATPGNQPQAPQPQKSVVQHIATLADTDIAAGIFTALAAYSVASGTPFTLETLKHICVTAAPVVVASLVAKRCCEAACYADQLA